MNLDITFVTCTAPVNIALIKYWGKRNEDLILPIAGSLSITLSKTHMCAKTTVGCSKHFPKDQFWLNGKEQPMDNPRLVACLTEIRKRASRTDLLADNYRLRIVSVNNFPTGAGLASSAAGYACLVSALAKLYGVDGNISDIARRGSGSACRSIFGGFVEWVPGELVDGHDSIARQIAPAEHWPELRILVLVVSDRQKTVGSTEGMRRGMATSDFMQYWARHIVPNQINQTKDAIMKKDFQALAMLMMKASNQLHAICMECYPPVIYMNHISHSIVNFVHQYNSACGSIRLAYTFDAGPNACLVLDCSDVPTVAALINHYFNDASNSEQGNFFKGIPINPVSKENLKNLIDKMDFKPVSRSLHYVLHTMVMDLKYLVE